MRRAVLFVALALLAFGTGAEAQVPDPNTFPTLAACNEALQSGRIRFYEPRYFGLRDRNPVDERGRIAVPLESDTCLEMLVVGGRRFVAQREGTLFRAHRLADGSLSLYARDDCGNPVYGIVFPAPVVAVPEAVPILRSVPVPARPMPMGPHRERHYPATPVTPKKKGGFCSSTKCKLAILAVGGAAAGYAVWQFWPCPPGTTHR